MSEVIVRMEMPTRCGACKCRHVEFDIDYVAVFCTIKDNLYVKDPDSRPSWCPIAGVLPDEHGRLGDLDRLAKMVDCARIDAMQEGYDTNPYWLLGDIIAQAKTIVPATESSET